MSDFTLSLRFLYQDLLGWNKGRETK